MNVLSQEQEKKHSQIQPKARQNLDHQTLKL